MSYAGIPRRPNEANENVNKALKFVEQANTLFELGILTTAQKKLVTEKLNNMAVKVKKLYELEDEHAKTLKEEKVAESLSSTFRSSVSLLENRLELSTINLRVEETRLKVQKKYDDIRQLSHSVQRINMETQREAERNEHRRICAKASNTELMANSEIIQNNLENSAEVCKLRRSEEKKRMTEEAVEKLRSQKIKNEADIKMMQATLKSEKKKSFQKVAIECARAHQLFRTLLPKLSSSKKNVENLRAEEISRKSNGSLDETILFDNSFVQVSQMDTTAGVASENGKAIVVTTPNAEVLPKPSEKEFAQKPTTTEKIEKIKIASPVNNESEIGSVSDSGNSVQNITLVDNGMEVEEEEEEKEDEEPKTVDESMEENQNEADDSKNLSEEAIDQDEDEEGQNGNVQLDDSQDEVMEQEQEGQKEQVEDNEHDKSIDVMMNEEGEENQDEEGVGNVSKNGSFNFSRDSNSGGFFDKLLAEKSSEDSSATKRSAADAILNISANSNDEASDLLKEMENQMSGDEVMSQGSGNDNFSFNIFGESSGGTNKDSGNGGNFDFNFGSSPDDNSGFDFMSGSGGDTDNDPFGFAKSSKKKGDASGDGMSFDFNFGSDNAATGESSFFNF